MLILILPAGQRSRHFYASTTTFATILDPLLATDTLTYLTHWPSPSASSLANHLERHRLFVLARESYLAALRMPHSPTYLAVLQVPNHTPVPTSTPSDWQRRLAKFALPAPVLLDQDRYLPELEPEDQWMASHLRVTCARYLLYKRRFFQAWYEEQMSVKEGERRSTNGWARWAQTGCGMHMRLEKAERMAGMWVALGWLKKDRDVIDLTKGGRVGGEDAEDRIEGMAEDDENDEDDE